MITMMPKEDYSKLSTHIALMLFRENNAIQRELLEMLQHRFRNYEGRIGSDTFNDYFIALISRNRYLFSTITPVEDYVLTHKEADDLR